MLLIVRAYFVQKLKNEVIPNQPLKKYIFLHTKAIWIKYYMTIPTSNNIDWLQKKISTNCT